MDLTAASLLEKKHCKEVWDMLAAEYYSEQHKTSRNFDCIINHNIQKIFQKLPSGLYLDLGGGRGRLEELYSNSNVSIIVGDFSMLMLNTKPRQFRTNPRIQMDAFNIPFRKNTFDGVFSFIGDSYAQKEVFKEVFRVLKLSGFFLLALPTKIWRQNLTSSLEIREDETIFSIKNNRKMKVPSFLYGSGELESALSISGFRKVNVGEWRPNRLIKREDFSEHVKIAARNFGVSPEELPLIIYAIAVKSPQCARH